MGSSNDYLIEIISSLSKYVVIFRINLVGELKNYW